eukprot:48853_1
MSSALSLWLQNRRLASLCSNTSLHKHESQIIELLGGLQNVLMLCFQSQYGLNYERQRNILPILLELVREQRQSNTNEPFNCDSLSLSSLNKACCFHLYTFLHPHGLTSLMQTNHSMHAFITQYQCATDPNTISLLKTHPFGGLFPSLYHLYDRDAMEYGLELILTKITKIGSRYVHRLCECNVISKIIQLTTDINDPEINLLAIRCVHKIAAAYSRYGRYLSNHKDELVYALCMKRYIGSRGILLHIMNLMGLLIKSRVYTPSPGDAIAICDHLTVHVLQNTQYKYDIKLMVEALNLIFGSLRCNQKQIDCKQLIDHAVYTMKELLRRYVTYIRKEWVYHINVDEIKVRDLVFIVSHDGRISSQRFESKAALLKHYDPDKFITFGICDSLVQQDVRPYFKSELACYPVMIAQILVVLNAYTPIALDSVLIADIMRTLYVDMFVWKERLFDSNYELRSGFILNMIQCDVRILLNDTITEYFGALKPKDLNYIFWLIATSNVKDNEAILTRFFDLMSDKHCFVNHCELYTSRYGRYPLRGMDAFIELIPTKYKRIGICKILQILKQSERFILRYVLNESKLLRFIKTHLINAKNEDVHLGIRLMNVLNAAIDRYDVDSWSAIRSTMNEWLCSVFENANILMLPMVNAGDDLFVDPIQNVYQSVRQNKDILAIVSHNKGIVRCMVDRVCAQCVGSIPFVLLMCLSMIIAHCLDTMDYCFVQECVPRIGLQLWIRSIVEWKEKIHASSVDTKATLRAVNYILEEHHHTLGHHQPRLFANFRLFLMECVAKHKQITQSILAVCYPNQSDNKNGCLF